MTKTCTYAGPRAPPPAAEPHHPGKAWWSTVPINKHPDYARKSGLPCVLVECVTASVQNVSSPSRSVWLPYGGFGNLPVTSGSRTKRHQLSKERHDYLSLVTSILLLEKEEVGIFSALAKRPFRPLRSTTAQARARWPPGGGHVLYIGSKESSLPCQYLAIQDHLSVR